MSFGLRLAAEPDQVKLVQTVTRNTGEFVPHRPQATPCQHTPKPLAATADVTPSADRLV